MGIPRRFTMRGVAMVLLVCFVCLGLAMADAGVDTMNSGESEKVAPLLKEIERLRTQVSNLDSDLEKKVAHISVIEKELKMFKTAPKDGGKALAKLEAELESKILTVTELENSLVTANKQSEQAHQYADALKKRAELAEQSARDLEMKGEKSQKKSVEWKKKALDAEKALKMAESTISEAEKKLRAHGDELSRVHGQWLPPWAASQLSVLQTRVKTKWSSHAKPYVDTVYKQAVGHVETAHSFVKPHLDTVSSKVYPEAQKHWKTLSDTVSPHVELIRTKTREGYDVVRNDYFVKVHDFLHPHINTVVDYSRPYYTVVQEHTRPYVDQLATISKPYLDQGKLFVSDNLKKFSPYYRDAVSAAVKHHENLQETVRSRMAKHDFSAAFISNELVWFLASALLALPVFTALLVFSSMFGSQKKEQHSRRSSPGGSASSGASGTKHHHKRSKKVDK